MSELTLQEYYEIVQAEGQLFKSLGYDALHYSSLSSPDPSRSIDSTSLLISTNDEDRYSDVLDPHGVDLSNFARNPMFLFEHGQKAPAAESVLGRIKSITKNDDSVIAEAQYILLENNPLPAKIWEMEMKGLIPANSIGWRPLANITKRDGKRYIGKWELLEVSKVLLPVNGKATNHQVAR